MYWGALKLFFIASQGRIIYGPTVRGQEFFIEPSRRYVVCRERNEDNGYSRAACNTAQG
jgi:hypothetical protein